MRASSGGDVGAAARLNFATRFELCHGLSAEASADAAAEVLVAVARPAPKPDGAVPEYQRRGVPLTVDAAS